MMACLRSARFVFPDDSGSIFVELRRRNDHFIVSERIPKLKVLRNINRGTYREGCATWDELVHKHEDSGMRRSDLVIQGFHEEG
jgi:hypothetical protein